MIKLSQLKDNMPTFPKGWELDVFNDPHFGMLVYGAVKNKGKEGKEVFVGINSYGTIDVESEEYTCSIPFEVTSWLFAHRGEFGG